MPNKPTDGPETSNGGGQTPPASPFVDDRRESIIDLSAYPILTESVQVSQGPSGPSDPGGDLGRTVTSAISDVLGWRPRGDDPKGFVGALTNSFSLRQVEGHVEWSWTPRSYAVQTDLAGGITGAQASLFARARQAADTSLPLLDGLYPLDVESDPQDAAALRAMIRSQIQDLVGELGIVGGPRVARVDQLLESLLVHDLEVPEAAVAGPGLDARADHKAALTPDTIKGTVGALRDSLGLGSTNDLANSVDEEQNQTNYFIVADNLIDLARVWRSHRDRFLRGGNQGAPSPFFGTQLVLLSRQLSVVAESVQELGTAFDSVFIGPMERQTLAISPRVWIADSGGKTVAIDQYRMRQMLRSTPDRLAEIDAVETFTIGKATWQAKGEGAIFLEELLSWVASFAATEGPSLIRDGGKLGTGGVFRPTAKRLFFLVLGAIWPKNVGTLPTGYLTPRVQRAWQELQGHLGRLVELTDRIGHPIRTEARGRDADNTEKAR